MDELKRFLEESPIAAKVALPTGVVLRRLSLSPDAVQSIVESGGFSPGAAPLGSAEGLPRGLPKGDEVCELEVGGQCIARGRIVRRRGKAYFKVVEMGEGGES
jgi:hypothetical protein